MAAPEAAFFRRIFRDPFTRRDGAMVAEDKWLPDWYDAPWWKKYLGAGRFYSRRCPEERGEGAKKAAMARDRAWEPKIDLGTIRDHLAVVLSTEEDLEDLSPAGRRREVLRAIRRQFRAIDEDDDEMLTFAHSVPMAEEGIKNRRMRAMEEVLRVEENDVEAERIRKILNSWLADLPSRAKQSLELARQGKSDEEIAEALHVHVQTVRRWRREFVTTSETRLLAMEVKHGA